MKKVLIILFPALLLTGCADKEQYKQAVLAEMQKEQALQKEQKVRDYVISVDKLTECVVDTSSVKMPGAFPFDPTRLTAYRNYTKMLAYRGMASELAVKKTANPQQALEEARKKLIEDFGSGQALSEAMSNYAQSIEDCYSAIFSESEDDEKSK